MAIRCLIVDDSRQFAQDARALLEEEGIQVVDLAADGDEAVRLAQEFRPDLVLVDINLGAESGLDVARRLSGEQPGVGGVVILISTHAEDECAELIAASPAIGFLCKSELSADAIDALLERSGQKQVP